MDARNSVCCRQTTDTQGTELCHVSSLLSQTDNQHPRSAQGTQNCATCLPSCPTHSSNRWVILFSSRFLSSATHSLTSPLLLKPRISKLMLDVLPDWISWRCRKRLRRALPRPLSSSPCVRTPNSVDFPESTFPRTATRRSKNYRKKNKEIIKFNHCCTECMNITGQWTCSSESFPTSGTLLSLILLRFCSYSQQITAQQLRYTL